jgi:hypothetical protein
MTVFLSVGAAQVSGEALLAVRAQVGHLYPRLALGRHGLQRGPYLLVKSDFAAVQDVCSLVGCQLILDAVEDEAGIADAVGVAAAGGPDVSVGFDIAVERIEPKRDIRQVAVPVGNLQ